ncbi:hypothetical protein KZ829_09475 [Actinoplanes hulinensis]|uniref:Uncharacterized protein n=1 Tax=Actinoplanes hulinensis TaxID=1144547 RepID=A0ABS7AYY9_9ACTN|nr:hypothetical protein [Actinoplanes hulinensis]MBW6433965.1 hypothetical protein [Actinoplanes hulinensis]
MEKRTDPVEILARVGERDGRARAFEVWCYRAQKAGWQVVVESTAFEDDGDECGIVHVEGLRYRIRHSPRVRRQVYYVDSGQHLISVAVAMTAGGEVEGRVTPAVEFDHAAWAEPIL